MRTTVLYPPTNHDPSRPTTRPDASSSGRAHVCQQPLFTHPRRVGILRLTFFGTATTPHQNIQRWHASLHFFVLLIFQVRYHSLLPRRHRQVVLYEGSKGRKKEEGDRALLAFWLWEGACRKREPSGSSCFCIARRFFLRKRGAQGMQGKGGMGFRSI